MQRGRGWGAAPYRGRGGYAAHRSWTNPSADPAVPNPTQPTPPTYPSGPHPSALRRPQYPVRSKNKSLMVVPLPVSVDAQPTPTTSVPPPSGYIKQGMALIRLDEHGQRMAGPPPTALPTMRRRIRKPRRPNLRLALSGSANLTFSRANADGLPLVADTHEWITKSKHSRQLISKEAIQKGLYTQSNAAMLTTTAAKQKRTLLLPFSSSDVLVHNTLADKLLTVNGVVFVMDRHGKKLVRQDVMLANAAKTAPKPKKAVPKTVMIGDQAYVRTKGGNLVRAASMKRRKVKRPCPTYLRTGTCPRATQPANPSPDFRLCTLNHAPAVQQIPLCRHFELGRCVSDACKYLHIKMPAHAKVCSAFARGGWCDNADRCQERHVWECPGWLNHGVCDVEGESVTIDETEKPTISAPKAGPRCGYKHYLWRKGFAMRTAAEEKARRDAERAAVRAEASRSKLDSLLPDFDLIDQRLLRDDDSASEEEGSSEEEEEEEEEDSSAEEEQPHASKKRKRSDPSVPDVLFVRDLEDHEVIEQSADGANEEVTEEEGTGRWDLEGDFVQL